MRQQSANRHQGDFLGIHSSHSVPSFTKEGACKVWVVRGRSPAGPLRGALGLVQRLAQPRLARLRQRRGLPPHHGKAKVPYLTPPTSERGAHKVSTRGESFADVSTLTSKFTEHVSKTAIQLCESSIHIKNQAPPLLPPLPPPKQNPRLPNHKKSAANSLAAVLQYTLGIPSPRKNNKKAQKVPPRTPTNL